MELIKAGTNFDFIRFRSTAFAVSAGMLIVALGALVFRGGPNWGVDFAGGTMVQVRFTDNPPIDAVREAIQPLGFGDATIQDFGASAAGGEEFLIRLPVELAAQEDTPKRIGDALSAKFGDKAEIQRIETVGPRVGADLRTRAVLSVLFATAMMGAYLAVRFELRFGLGAALALLHDVIITTGLLALFNYEFDLTIVAALLTVVGFSVNDTVIISDRIRENMHKDRRNSLAKIINSSINETLSRTILTSGTAIMVLLALFFLGGNVINGFAFALLIGIIVGTYSSIYVASPVVLLLERGGTRKS